MVIDVSGKTKEENMIKEVIRVFGEIFSSPKPPKDVFGPEDFKEILKKRRK